MPYFLRFLYTDSQLKVWRKTSKCVNIFLKTINVIW